MTGELAALFDDLRTRESPPPELTLLLPPFQSDTGTLLVAHADAGRVLLAALEAGRQAHGVEPSAARHRRAESRVRTCGREVPVFYQTLDVLNLPFRYGGAAIGARELQRLERPRALKALQRVGAHLVPPAVVVLELTVPACALHPPGAPIVEIERLRTDDSEPITRRSEQVIDREAKSIAISERYERRSGGRVSAREDLRYRFAWYDEEEARRLALGAGFAQVQFRTLPCADVNTARRYAMTASL
ncbi:MAG: hypothetical protein M3Z31_12745 [Pseudomonadota bacterium]|nr:hypothetical protein [Pseudomonadota bacterium]